MDNDLETLIRQVSHHDPDNPDAAWQAAIALGEYGYANADEITTAMAALSVAMQPTSHALTRAHAAEALGKLGDQRAVPALIGALNDEYHLVRTYAAAALGDLGDESAIEPLTSIVERDPFFGARATAVAAIGELCFNSNSPACQRAREVLRARRIKEESSDDERSQRILREIDRALGPAQAIDQSDKTGATRVIAEVDRALERMRDKTHESNG